MKLSSEYFQATIAHSLRKTADDSVPEKDRRKDDAPKRAEDQIGIVFAPKAVCYYPVADERGDKREGENEEGDRAVVAYFKLQTFRTLRL